VATGSNPTGRRIIRSAVRSQQFAELFAGSLARDTGNVHYGTSWPLSVMLLNFACALSIMAGIFVGPTHLERFQNWIWGTPAGQQEIVTQPPQLSQEAEALLGDAYQQMVTLFEVFRLDQKLQAPPSF
jgi:hypothetical protein